MASKSPTPSSGGAAGDGVVSPKGSAAVPREKMTDKMKRLFGGKKDADAAAAALKGAGKEGRDIIPGSNFDIDELENRPLDKLAACDTLFEEIRVFLWQAKETIDFTTKSKQASMGAKIGLPPMGVSSGIQKWRAKRKGG